MLHQRSDGRRFEAGAGQIFETSKELPKTFAWRRLRTGDLHVTNAFDWPIDQPEQLVFKGSLKSVYVSQNV